MFLDELSMILKLKVSAEERITLAQAETEKIIVAEQELERQRIITLRTRYRGVEELEGRKSTWLSDEEVIDLSVARTNKLIWNRPGKGFYITHFYGTQDNTKIRFNSVSAPFYRVNRGYIKTDFDKIYLTNTAQAGKVLQFVISSRETTEFGLEATFGIQSVYFDAHNSMEYLEHLKLNNVRAACTPTIYNVEIENPNAEYSQPIPEGTKRFRAVLADGTAFRLAWVAGKVATPTAPYWTQPANIPYVEDSGLFTVVTPLYFACGTGSKVMQIACWV